ncbi:Uncharacterised protein [Mycobacterium tuberculosis]|uniref:Uncharacterized protein n=1 Tax=Mycobacterium tuberculosis TaxID=1773 RepID=A0A655JF95_MYCTX|nr:Uncharacterised protein [Mycobacterium tuberculosis]CKU52216.1 Uncharacterised protein [Mycobacterium tuberculosis]CNM84951.1 Uncharacterised protein [Mycobacterium tuberculosis]CNN03525.1 Uncharacterised protein [Mycobacterium tuberculosis]CNN49530.1 Uncharacterised protein [Mycobacterium tuberculosis]
MSTTDFLRPIALARMPPPSAPAIWPSTAVVVSNSCSRVVSSNSSLRDSNAPAMAERSYP